jgi:hypothetical protein
MQRSPTEVVGKLLAGCGARLGLRKFEHRPHRNSDQKANSFSFPVASYGPDFS